MVAEGSGGGQAAETVGGGPDAERVGGSRTTSATASAVRERADALHGLNEAVTQKRNQHEADAVETPVKDAVTAAKDGLVVSKNGAEKAAIEVRIPCSGDAWAEPFVKRVVGILRFSRDVVDQREPDLRIVDLPLKGGGFATF